jgi:hypothetical protein
MSNHRKIGYTLSTPHQFLIGFSTALCTDEYGDYICYELGFLLFSIEYCRYITDTV